MSLSLSSKFAGGKESLIELLDPGVQALGFEIIELEFGGAPTTLRVYIDGPNGVDVDDCANVSRHLSTILDVEDPIAGNYNLEVSSPGIDRPLARPIHFAAVVGETVRVHTHLHHLGRRRFLGRLAEANDESIVVDVDGEAYELAYRDIEKARLVADA